MDTALADSYLAAISVKVLLIFFCLVWLTLVVASLRRKRRQQRALVDKINVALPQTQCGQCGYEGCRPYARAISRGEAINQCPPGGNDTIIKLAILVNDKPSSLNPAHGTIEPLKLAFIREDECIGCTKCIKACPVDAILGGPKLMHTVIASECTGCDLCVEPCPVDCIDMLAVPDTSSASWSLPKQIGNPRLALEVPR